MNSSNKQTQIYSKLYEISKNINESIDEERLFNIGLKFIHDDLGYEKGIIFKHNESNGWFRVEQSVGYDKPHEQMVLKIINLLLSGEIIEYLRRSGKPILHTQSAPDEKVVKLANSLFLSEAYFELFGGDVKLPYALIIAGNSMDKRESSPNFDSVNQLALGNAISQFSNAINNIIFYKAYENEKKELERNIQIRTKELEAQRNRFQTIYETSKDGIAILDAQTTAFLETNQAFADMTGYTKIELMKTSCLKLSFEEDIPRSKVAIQKVMKDGYITNFIKKCKTKNGSFVIVNLSVSNLHDGTVLLSGKDITQIEEAQKRVEAEKENFEFLFNNTIEAIGLFKEYKFIDINEAGIKLFGFQSKEEALGKPTLSVVAPESIELAKRQLGTVIDTPYELMAQKVTGEKFPALVRGLNTVVNGEEIRVTTLIDISDLKNKEKELELAKDKAEESAKLKSEFLANMSHEIRTPMNGILGMSHLALQTSLSDKQKNYIQKIDSSAKNLLGIINDILDFSKIESGKLTIEKVEFDLFKTVDAIIHLMELKVHEKNLELIVSYSPDMGRNFYGDSLRISQIITNLVGNAVKFTESGEIGIYISKVAQDRFRFEVRDTGIGLSKEQQSKLFQSFSQADGSTTRKYGGTGLGLSISKQLVELMNGKIWVESELNIGSKFIFEMELEERFVERKFNLFNDKKVLIVDDSESWHEILTNTLEMFGVNVDHAYSGAEAIQKTAQCQNQYDLILMDWNMPKLDGIETTKIINNECTTCMKKGMCTLQLPPSVIMVSSFRQESVVKLANEVGIDIFLQKPLNPSVLNDMLSGVFLGDTKQYNDIHKDKKSLKQSINTLQGSQILLAEDNETNQEIVLGLLENSGIDIDIAANGKEAVEMFLKDTTKYELILMDIQMPILDGYEATRLIREESQEVPIIALTANAMKEDIEKTKSAGMNEHLNKPIEVEKLYETLLKYISKKIEITESVTKNRDNLEIPNFINIDPKVGLSYMAENKKLYLKILNDFYNNYKDLKLESLQDEELKRVIHTIKGLSANIGATTLSDISKDIEETKDRELYPRFYEELNRVLEELKDLESQIEKNDKQEIPKELRDELFANLKQFASKRRARQCREIIDELNNYELTATDRDFTKQVEKLLSQRKYKDIVEMIENARENYTRSR